MKTGEYRENERILENRIAYKAMKIKDITEAMNEDIEELRKLVDDNIPF